MLRWTKEGTKLLTVLDPLNVSRSNIREQVWWLEIWHSSDHLGYSRLGRGEWNKPYFSHLNVPRQKDKTAQWCSCNAPHVCFYPVSHNKSKRKLVKKETHTEHVYILLDLFNRSSYYRMPQLWHSPTDSPQVILGSTVLRLCFPDFDNLKLLKKDSNRLIEMLPMSLPRGNKAISFILISKKRQFWQYLLWNATVSIMWKCSGTWNKWFQRHLAIWHLLALSYLAGQVPEALVHLWLTAKETRSSDF